MWLQVLAQCPQDQVMGAWDGVDGEEEGPEWLAGMETRRVQRPAWLPDSPRLEQRWWGRGGGRAEALRSRVASWRSLREPRSPEVPGAAESHASSRR